MNKAITCVVVVFLIFSSCKRNSFQNTFSDEDVKKMDLQNTVSVEPLKDSLSRIDLNPFLASEEFLLEDILSEIKTIQLETNSSSIVGGIYKIITTEKNIYIHDNYQGGGVIIFDINGRFIKRLERGNGPGEIYRVWDMDYDYQNEELYVYQHPFFLVFDKNGNYQRDIRLPFGFYNFKVTPDGYIFKTIHTEANYHMDEYHKYTLFVTDKTFKILHASMNSIYDVGLIDMSYLHTCKDKWIVTQPLSDTIYSIGKDNTFRVEYVLDYKENHIKDHALTYDNRHFMNYINEHDEYYHLGKHLETLGYSAFFLNGKRGTCMVYRNKKTGKMDGGRMQAVTPHCLPPIPFPISTYGDYFISLVNPYDYIEINSGRFLSNEQINSLKAMETEDNPMLVLYKIENL